MGHAQENGRAQVRSSTPSYLCKGKVTHGSASIASQTHSAIGSNPVFTRTGVGTYTVAGLPVGFDGFLWFLPVSATIVTLKITALDPFAGTAAFTAQVAAGTAADFANTEVLRWEYQAEGAR